MDRRARIKRAERIEAEERAKQKLAALPPLPHPPAMRTLMDIVRENLRQDAPVLYGLALVGPRVLEIGSSVGGTVALLMGVRDSGIAGARLVSINADDVPEVYLQADQLNLKRHWTFHRGNPRELLPTLGQVQFQTIVMDVDQGDGSLEPVDLHESFLASAGVVVVCGPGARASVRAFNLPGWQGALLPFERGLAIWQRR